MIGTWHGRSAEFDWNTSLDRLGFSVSEEPSLGLADEIYTTIDGVDYAFDVGAPVGKCEIRFTSKYAVAAQGYHTSFRRLLHDDLKGKLLPKIRSGELEWNMNWVIVTEVWESDAFTTLISGARRGHVEISAKGVGGGTPFNLADINMGVRLSRSSGMGYSGVAETGVTPYFHIKRIVYDGRRDIYYIKRYGR